MIEIYDIHKKYISIFDLLKKQKYEEVWNLIDNTNKSIGCVRINFDEHCNDYFLEYISEVLSNLEKLYPYKLFASRELLIKKVKCNICGKLVSPRCECTHIPLKLYMGKLCQYIVESEGAEFLGISIVKKPMDKYALLKVSGKDFDYKLLDSFAKRIDSPYRIWTIKCSKYKKDVFKNVNRNDLCPCGTGKKYKRCCYGTNNEFYNNTDIIFINPPAEYSYDYKQSVNEWVETALKNGFDIIQH